jgi:uncharacterized membrane protein YbhN (UPF0104 family)
MNSIRSFFISHTQTFKGIWRWLRFGIAAAPFIWIFSKINPSSLGSAICHVAWWTIPVFLALMTAAMLLQGVRWWVLVKSFVPTLTLSRALIGHCAGLYYSLVLPTSGAQDIVRGFIVAREADYAVVWGATVVTRLLGVIVLAAFSLFGFTRLNLALPLAGDVRWYAALSCMAIIGLLALAFSKKATKPLRIVFSSRIPKRILVPVEKIRNAVYLYRGKPLAMLLSFGITAIFQAALILNAAFLIKGITGHAHLVECFALLPLVEFICVSLPLTPNGVGVREALMALMFRYLAIGTNELGIYITLGFLTLLLRLAGGLALPFVKKQPQ